MASDGSELPAGEAAAAAAATVDLLPARDYEWCGATRRNVPQLLGGQEVEVPLQVRHACKPLYTATSVMHTSLSCRAKAH